MNLPINANSGELTMSSLEIADLVEKQHRHVTRDIRKMLDELDLGTAQFWAVYQADNGQQYECFNLPRRECDILIAGYNIKYRAAIVDRWHELEDKVAKPALPQNYIESLQALIVSEQEKQQAITERDQAIKTKGQISSRREAVAMGRLSAASRKVKKLEHDLGFSSRHATILQVDNALGGSYSFLPLRKWCKDNGVTAETVPDKRYPKGVKAWPAGAWLECYGVDLVELFGSEGAA